MTIRRLNAEVMRFARGVRGHALPIIFLKWCDLVRYWCIFGSNFDFNKFRKVRFFIYIFLNHHLYKKFKNYHFYMLWGNSRREIF